MFVFAADLHLAPRAWSGLPEIEGDAYNSFGQIVEFCLTHKVSGLILGGDNFDDTRLHSRTVHQFREKVKRLAGIPLYYIQGQHCRSDPPWPTIVLDYPVIRLDRQLITMDGVRLYGLDHRPLAELRDELQHLPPDVEILCLHQLCRQALPYDGAWDFDLDDIRGHKALRFVLMGDYHQPWEMDYLRADKEFVRAAYSGSQCMQANDENPSKSFITIEGDTIHRIPLKTRPFDRLLIRTEKELDEAEIFVTDFEPNEVGRPLVFASFNPELKNVEDRLRPKLRGVLVLRPIPADEPTPEAPKEKATLGACLNRLVDPAGECKLHSFLTELIAHPEPAKAIEHEYNRVSGEKANED